MADEAKTRPLPKKAVVVETPGWTCWTAYTPRQFLLADTEEDAKRAYRVLFAMHQSKPVEVKAHGANQGPTGRK